MKPSSRILMIQMDCADNYNPRTAAEAMARNAERGLNAVVAYLDEEYEKKRVFEMKFPEIPKAIKVSCNECGAGKKLYWVKKILDRRMGYAEKTDIQSTLHVQDIKKGCPKCGGELSKES